MLFIVGGAARSGKTLLARRMLSDARVAWFPLDGLRNGLTVGAPSLGFDFDHDDLEEGDRMWPIIREMAASFLRDDDIPYLLEGSCLRPSRVADLRREAGEGAVRALFLGYPDVSADEKLRQIAVNRIGGNDWFSNLTDADRLSHVHRMIRDSRTVQADCAASGMPFFDTGVDFETAQAAALDYLKRSSPV